jgi:hypothetical protein
MKNKFRTIVAVSVFLMLTIVNVSAQTPAGAEVDIPFDFSAGKASLKAGTYTITRGSNNTLLMRSHSDKKTVLLNAPLTIGSRDFRSGQRIVFNRYGSNYFLTQVWLTVDEGRQLLPSKAETTAARELANRNVKSERVEIAVRGR